MRMLVAPEDSKITPGWLRFALGFFQESPHLVFSVRRRVCRRCATQLHTDWLHLKRSEYADKELQRAPERDIIQMLSVGSASAIAIRPLAAEKPSSKSNAIP